MAQKQGYFSQSKLLSVSFVMRPGLTGFFDGGAQSNSGRTAAYKDPLPCMDHNAEVLYGLLSFKIFILLKVIS